MADLIDNLCQATQIIVDKAIEELKFDKTVTGKIIDNSKANIGDICLKYGGGGHRNAGTCQIPNDQVDIILPKILEDLNAE